MWRLEEYIILPMRMSEKAEHRDKNEIQILGCITGSITFHTLTE